MHVAPAASYVRTGWGPAGARGESWRLSSGPVRGQCGPAHHIPPRPHPSLRPRSDLVPLSAAPGAASCLRPGLLNSCSSPAGRGWARPASPLRLPVRPPRRATRPPGTPPPSSPPSLSATASPATPHPGGSQGHWTSWNPLPALQGHLGPRPHTPPSSEGCPGLLGPLYSPHVWSQAACLPGDRSSRQHSLGGAEGGSGALGHREQLCAQRAPSPQPRDGTWQGCERSTGGQPAARSRGRLDFERKTELIAISANRRALVRVGGQGRPQPASTRKGRQEANRDRSKLFQTQPMPLPRARRCEGGSGVFMTCSHRHKGLISQPPPDPWSSGSADFPGQRPGAGFGGTEAWAASGLWGRYKLRIYSAEPGPFRRGL